METFVSVWGATDEMDGSDIWGYPRTEADPPAGYRGVTNPPLHGQVAAGTVLYHFPTAPSVPGDTAVKVDGRGAGVPMYTAGALPVIVFRFSCPRLRPLASETRTRSRMKPEVSFAPGPCR